MSTKQCQQPFREFQTLWITSLLSIISYVFNSLIFQSNIATGISTVVQGFTVDVSCKQCDAFVSFLHICRCEKLLSQY